MGLDTSHDCYHGSYRNFSKWRCYLHSLISGEDDSNAALTAAWNRGHYEGNDATAIINILMNHLDCDGWIGNSNCLPLAAALCELLDQMPPDGVWRETTNLFIEGLRLAACRGEDVAFH